jgi:hypothetical protein
VCEIVVGGEPEETVKVTALMDVETEGVGGGIL